MKILIVDDDRIALVALQAALTALGHQVELARDGLEAMEIVRKGSCRLVISDCQMPRMNGPELCKAIRSEDMLGYVYVILLTAHDGPDEMVNGLSAGADDFISKPFRPRELSARLKTAERILALETRDVAIFTMAKLAESRDFETGEHLERVRIYSRILAQYLSTQPKFQGQVDAEFVRLIYLTSPLHDIGKVAIPDSVLLQPGRLSDRQFEIMKSHTSLGAATLEAALEQFPGVKFLQMARDIAASHHERVDGSGYPSGLSGDAIPLAARIVALADVYDALTSKRVYKDAFTHEVARSIILEGTGSHFDRDIVDAFIHSEMQFIEISQSFRDDSKPASLPPQPETKSLPAKVAYVAPRIIQPLAA